MTGPIITLLSDFGTSDGYAAAMKGVILDVVPNAILVDAAHEIRAHDIQAASWALAQYAFTFPEGTTHIAVVDPDVGTDRDLLVATAGGHTFFAPNNGLVHWISRSAAGFEVRRIRDDVSRPEGKSNTFHRRASTSGPMAPCRVSRARCSRLRGSTPGPRIRQYRFDHGTIAGTGHAAVGGSSLTR